MKSTKLQPSFSGQYIRLDDPLNGRPVYKHTTRSRFLYFVDVQTKFWLFGPELGQNHGLILARNDAKEPSEVNTAWRAYDNSDMSWKDDDSVSLQCDDQGRVSVTCSLDICQYAILHYISDIFNLCLYIFQSPMWTSCQVEMIVQWVYVVL